MIDTSRGNNFQESFEQFEGLRLSSRSFSIQQPAPITYEFAPWENVRTKVKVWIFVIWNMCAQ